MNLDFENEFNSISKTLNIEEDITCDELLLKADQLYYSVKFENSIHTDLNEFDRYRYAIFYYKLAFECGETKAIYGLSAASFSYGVVLRNSASLCENLSPLSRELVYLKSLVFFQKSIDLYQSTGATDPIIDDAHREIVDVNFELGRMFQSPLMNGFKDLEKAVRYFMICADNNYNSYLTYKYLGECFFEGGFGIESDPRRALSYFLKQQNTELNILKIQDQTELDVQVDEILFDTFFRTKHECLYYIALCYIRLSDFELAAKSFDSWLSIPKYIHYYGLFPLLEFYCNNQLFVPEILTERRARKLILKDLQKFVNRPDLTIGTKGNESNDIVCRVHHVIDYYLRFTK